MALQARPQDFERKEATVCLVLSVAPPKDCRGDRRERNASEGLAITIARFDRPANGSRTIPDDFAQPNAAGSGPPSSNHSGAPERGGERNRIPGDDYHRSPVALISGDTMGDRQQYKQKSACRPALCQHNRVRAGQNGKLPRHRLSLQGYHSRSCRDYPSPATLAPVLPPEGRHSRP